MNGATGSNDDGIAIDFKQLLKEERRRARQRRQRSQSEQESISPSPDETRPGTTVAGANNGRGDVLYDKKPSFDKKETKLSLLEPANLSELEQKMKPLDYRQLVQDERQRRRCKANEHCDTAKLNNTGINGSFDISGDSQNLPPWRYPPGYLSFKTDATTKSDVAYDNDSSSYSNDKYLMCSQPPTLHYIPNILTEDMSSTLWDWLLSLPQNESGMGAWKTLKYGKRRVAMMGDGCSSQSQRRGTTNEDESNNSKSEDNGIDTLPGPLKDISQLLVQHDLFPCELPPNHVLLNDYFDPTQGILPHTDGPSYAPRTATISLGQDAPVLLTFTPRRRSDDQHKEHQPSSTQQSERSGRQGNAVLDDEKDKHNDRKNTVQIVLHPNSLVLFQDDLYTNFCHGIEMLNASSLQWNNNGKDDIVEIAGTNCVNASPNTTISRGPRRLSLTFRHKYVN